MPKPIAVTFAATLLAGLATFAPPAQAANYYPWCIQYGGGWEGIGATSCGFVSWAQCMESASGVRAMCVENPANPPRERAARPRRKTKSE
jgi:hypothetical protein